MSATSVRVLMYHGVEAVSADRDPHAMFVRPEMFRAQMEHLLESGFTPIDEATYLQALDGGPLPRKPVMVTFDDGYVSVAENAERVLADLAIPSVLYLPVGLLGRRAEWLADGHRHALMTLDEIADLDLDRIALGIHGSDHSDLAGMDCASLSRNTVEARRELGRQIGRSVRTFAYPYGSHDPAARAAVERAGFEAAVSVHDAAGRYAIRRVDINATDTLPTFRIKMNRWYGLARRASDAVPVVRRYAHGLLGSAVDADSPAPLRSSAVPLAQERSAHG